MQNYICSASENWNPISQKYKLTNSYICRTYNLQLQDFNNIENNNKEPHHNWITSLNPFGYVIIVLAVIFFVYCVVLYFMCISEMSYTLFLCYGSYFFFKGF